jgi:hypothetical protein
MLIRTLLIPILALLILPLAAEARAPARRPALAATPARPAPTPTVTGPAAPAAAATVTLRRSAPPLPGLPRVQKLSFEDDYVTGNRDLGGGDMITEPKKPRFMSLVRPRDSFVPELIKSAEDI